MRAWLHALRPAPVQTDAREKLRVVLGAALGIFIAALISHWAGGGAAWPWMIAPMGASAVLVFAVPASPLAQPWAVVGGNTVSALVGVACAHFIPHVESAAALAVGLSIASMFVLRCLHPPGGATALLAVLTGMQQPWFAVFPVLTNAVVLVAVGMLYNSATRRAYPHRTAPAAAPPLRDAENDALEADLDAVLARYNQVLAISREELKALLNDTQLQAYQRKLADLRCSDIMSRELVTVGHQTPLSQAWRLFDQHHIKALPVVDAAGSLVGIVTPANFLRATYPLATGAAQTDGAADNSLETRVSKLRSLTSETTPANGEPVVARIMTRQVRVASMHRHLAELIPLFASSGHHHIPIVDIGGQLVGIVTQTDVVAALARPEPVLRG